MNGRVLGSDYMRWAKLQAGARFNLANSGVASFPLRDLPARLEEIELTGPSRYGYEPLQMALAAKCGVPAGCVCAALGTSLANHLALALLAAPGEDVLIEQPTYELLVATARYLGARVRRFPRPFGKSFQIDVDALERAVTDRTRVIVLTHPHNPSGALSSEDALRTVGQIARRVGARVLVDEVYLDAISDPPPPSAFHLGDEFVVTSSLTKVYGLSGLRCGWILAQPGLVERLWRLNDLFGVIPAHPAERLSVIALQHLDLIAARARRLLTRNLELLRAFAAARPDLEFNPPPGGMMAFPRLRRGSVEGLCRRLRDQFETTVVPGRFFDSPEHFRIGVGGETAMVAEGLRRLGQALDAGGATAEASGSSD